MGVKGLTYYLRVPNEMDVGEQECVNKYILFSCHLDIINSLNVPESFSH